MPLTTNERRCVDCGGDISHLGAQAQFCGECKRRKKREYQRAYQQMNKKPTFAPNLRATFRRIHREDSGERMPPDLNEMARRAREAGMTYGQYMVHLKLQEEKKHEKVGR